METRICGKTQSADQQQKLFIKDPPLRGLDTNSFLFDNKSTFLETKTTVNEELTDEDLKRIEKEISAVNELMDKALKCFSFSVQQKQGINMQQQNNHEIPPSPTTNSHRQEDPISPSIIFSDSKICKSSSPISTPERNNGSYWSDLLSDSSLSESSLDEINSNLTPKIEYAAEAEAETPAETPAAPKAPDEITLDLTPKIQNAAEVLAEAEAQLADQRKINMLHERTLDEADSSTTTTKTSEKLLYSGLGIFAISGATFLAMPQIAAIPMVVTALGSAIVALPYIPMGLLGLGVLLLVISAITIWQESKTNDHDTTKLANLDI